MGVGRCRWRGQRSRRGPVGEAYVAVATEVLQQLDLAKSSLGENLLAEDIGDLLDGNAFVGLVVYGGAVGGGLIVSMAG